MKRMLFAVAAFGLAATSPATANPELAQKKNCNACHSVDKKVLGPSYREIAAKYKGDRAHTDNLAAKIMKGGSGVWGPVPMAANPQVTAAEAKQLAAWILSQK